MENLQLIIPEIFISLSIMFLLILGVFKKNSSALILNFSLIVLFITAVIVFNETIAYKYYGRLNLVVKKATIKVACYF